ncbi:M48 family metallopeptidase [Falsirhodobacter sp. alg1]|uniref:M48 family metallopeptidase n=1 Tax=Falsirhodobacter sp. alg1 TaxID=1472418 RepID=UPI001EDBFB6B|nr:SprT family zinc-dependent metalloprotease [Falsirhodobacter sp. alg1]
MMDVAVPSLPGLPDVVLVIRRSARSRRFSLRVSQLDGRVTLSMPLRAPLADGMAFAVRHKDWLQEVLADIAPPTLVGFGTVLPVEGRSLTLCPGKGPVRIEGESLILPVSAPAARAAGWLRTLARGRLAEACDRHSAALGLPYSRLTLRDTRSRWGSCTANGALMFSWRLIMAPPRILDYVAAHEVAHLAEMNHSQAFWNVVEGLCPEYRTCRAWLRGPDGQALQSWRFA